MAEQGWRRGAREDAPDHDRRAEPPPGRPTWSSGTSPRTAPEPAVGRRPDLRRDLVRLGLRGLRHRRLHPPHRRLAGLPACAPTWPSTPWRWPSGPRRDAHDWPGWSITPTAAANTLSSATPSGSPRPARSPRSARRRQLRQRPGRDHHRAVQDRADPPRGPWRGIDQVEFATLEWVDWFNHRAPPRIAPTHLNQREARGSSRSCTKRARPHRVERQTGGSETRGVQWPPPRTGAEVSRLAPLAPRPTASASHRIHSAAAPGQRG